MENPTDNRRKLSVDPKCFKLAQHFLPDDAPETQELAEWIQYHVELFLQADQITDAKITLKGT